MIKVNYGLIAILPDPSKQEEELEILHFCGYEQEPDQKDIEYLHEELKSDETLGLVDIADKLVIIPASPELVDIYRTMIYNSNNE